MNKRTRPLLQQGKLTPRRDCARRCANILESNQGVTMQRLSQISSRAMTAVTALTIGICALGLLSTQRAAAQTAGDSVIYLNQAWSQADRETYYQISQGSQ